MTLSFCRQPPNLPTSRFAMRAPVRPLTGRHCAGRPLARRKVGRPQRASEALGRFGSRGPRLFYSRVDKQGAQLASGAPSRADLETASRLQRQEAPLGTVSGLPRQGAPLGTASQVEPRAAATVSRAATREGPRADPGQTQGRPRAGSARGPGCQRLLDNLLTSYRSVGR